MVSRTAPLEPLAFSEVLGPLQLPEDKMITLLGARAVEPDALCVLEDVGHFPLTEMEREEEWLAQDAVVGESGKARVGERAVRRMKKGTSTSGMSYQ
jgi:hypothetical protein